MQVYAVASLENSQKSMQKKCWIFRTFLKEGVGLKPHLFWIFVTLAFGPSYFRSEKQKEAVFPGVTHQAILRQYVLLCVIIIVRSITMEFEKALAGSQYSERSERRVTRDAVSGYSLLLVWLEASTLRE